MSDRALIIGAGMGGLAAAIGLARAGYAVTVLERAAQAGGKMREVQVGGAPIDSGPTVLTMRWVFEELFESAGARLTDHVSLIPLAILARHAWSGGARLDLFADQERSADAIGAFAGAAEARGYRAFCAESKRMYDVLRAPFLSACKPNPLTLAARIGPQRAADLFAIRPFDTMWSALGAHFHDPRLRQLFGRYATYCGASPFAAPATLMLIAHVEQEGVWVVDGGMQRLAEALAACAKALGVVFQFSAHVDTIEVDGGRASGVRLRDETRLTADVVICNADAAALAEGLFGPGAQRAFVSVQRSRRSLSAMTWAIRAPVRGFPLLRHNVFFSDEYAAEFDALFKQKRMPADPTIYVCAQDRADDGAAEGVERLLVLANAPANGDAQPLSPAEIAKCETTIFNALRRRGLEIEPIAAMRTGPAEFNALFPATGGALYGQATHGWAAAFQRPGARTKIPGLYLAGGGAHPGAGVPMAALSGRLAAQAVLADRVLTRPFLRAAMPGGTSTRSAMTSNTA